MQGICLLKKCAFANGRNCLFCIELKDDRSYCPNQRERKEAERAAFFKNILLEKRAENANNPPIRQV